MSSTSIPNGSIEGPKERTKRRVALVCPPFADYRLPSGALATLAEALRSRGHEVDVFHLHVEAAAAIGLETYLNLMNGTSWFNQAGEWVFADPAITPGAATRDEYRAILGRGSLEVDIGYLRRSDEGERWLYDELALDRVRGRLAVLLKEWIGRAWQRYHVVGFSVAFQQLNASMRLAAAIKASAPDVRVVLGGAALEQPMGNAILRRYPWLDAVFSGYADRTFPAYVEALPAPSSRPIEHIGAELALDELPTPDYDDYFAALRAAGLERRVDVRGVPLETSRGCWWGEKTHCVFCGFNANQMKFRQKSPERTYEQVRVLARYRKPIFLVDNILPRNLFTGLFPRMTVDGFRFPAGGYLFTRSNLDRAQIVALRDVGATVLQPGIESLDTSVLRSMKKGTTGVKNVWLLRAAEELSLRASWSLLYGVPGEEPAAYDRMRGLLPLVAHLAAPSGAFEILMNRYSPIHEFAHELGLGGVRPARGYVAAFGGHATLGDQAYTFEYERTNGNDPRRYARDVVTEVERWIALKSRPLAPRCEVLRLFGLRILVDTRRLDLVGRSFPRVRVLDDLEWDVLEELESPVLVATWERRFGGDPRRRRTLDDLLSGRLVLELDHRLVRLVVIRADPRLWAEAQRVLADKLHRARFASPKKVATGTLTRWLSPLRDGTRASRP